jgi:hypothetical protein
MIRAHISRLKNDKSIHLAAWGFLALLGEVAAVGCLALLGDVTTVGCRLEYQATCIQQRGGSMTINRVHQAGIPEEREETEALIQGC